MRNGKAFRLMIRPEPRRPGEDYRFYEAYFRQVPEFRTLRTVVIDEITEIGDLMAKDHDRTDYQELGDRRKFLNLMRDIIPDTQELAHPDDMIIGYRLSIREIVIR